MDSGFEYYAMSKKILLLIIGVLGLKAVSAYIDPGTGGMIVSSIWPFILGILAAIGGFFIKYFFKPIKTGVLALWKRIKGKY